MSDSNDILPSGTTGMRSDEGRGIAIGALIFSLLGIIPLIGVVFIIIGLVLGIIVLSKHKPGKNIAIASLIIGIFLIILQIVMVLLILTFYIGPNPIYLNGTKSSFFPSTFIMAAPFSATTQSINSNEISFGIKNNGGETINIKNIYLSVVNPSSASCSLSIEKTLLPSEESVFYSECIGINSKDNVIININILYTSGENLLERSALGTLSGKAS